MGKSLKAPRVELVLTTPTGERIEVEADLDGRLYVDVENGEQCTLNYAKQWSDMTDERRQKTMEFIERITDNVKVLGLA